MPRKSIKQRTREAVIAKCKAVDFSKMSQEEYGDFINSLPPHEFGALITIHDEFLRSDKNPPSKEPAYVAPYTADDPHGTWVDFYGADQPVKDGVVVWVTYPEGDIGGPNVASAFLWGDEIASYAIAKNARARQE